MPVILRPHHHYHHHHRCKVDGNNVGIAWYIRAENGVASLKFLVAGLRRLRYLRHRRRRESWDSSLTTVPIQCILCVFPKKWELVWLVPLDILRANINVFVFYCGISFTFKTFWRKYSSLFHKLSWWSMSIKSDFSRSPRCESDRRRCRARNLFDFGTTCVPPPYKFCFRTTISWSVLTLRMATSFSTTVIIITFSRRWFILSMSTP